MPVKQAARTAHNPNAIRRCVRRTAEQPAGAVVFVTKSFTRENEVEHNAVVDIETGAVHCTCEHFTYRLAKNNPTVFSPEDHLCKHLLRALNNMARRGELPQSRGQFTPKCAVCGQTDADNYFEMADATGHAIPGRFICCDCAVAQTDDLSDAAPDADEMDALAARYDGNRAITPDPQRPGYTLTGDVDYVGMFED